MKILHVNTIDTGGAAIAAKRLHLLLLEKGIESKMLFLKRSRKTEIPEAYYLEDSYSPIVFKLIFQLNKLYNRRQTFLKPEVYFNGPDSLFNISSHPLFAWADVVHLHWVVKFLDWKKVFAHKNKKFVWTCHDMNPFTGGEHYKTGYKGEFTSVSGKNIRKKTDALKNVSLNVICPSVWLSELAKSSDVFSSKKVSAIRNPIDDRIFKPLHNDGNNGIRSKKNILFVAENPHDERKGFSILLNALKKIDPEIYQLKVLGNKLFVESQFPGAHFYGSVSDEQELVKIYNDADLFIIPSVEDNLPNTVSEALLCGTPVIGMPVGGIREMISEGSDGFLSNGTEDLHTAIDLGLHHSFDRLKVCEAAKSKINKDKLVDDIVSVYNS